MKLSASLLMVIQKNALIMLIGMDFYGSLVFMQINRWNRYLWQVLWFSTRFRKCIAQTEKPVRRNFAANYYDRNVWHVNMSKMFLMW